MCLNQLLLRTSVVFPLSYALVIYWLYVYLIVGSPHMTSKKTIAEKNLTTIQLSKPTVQQLRRAESYRRETYDCIISRTIQANVTIAAKLKGLESYPNEPYESIVARLVGEHNRSSPGLEHRQSKSAEPEKAETGEPNAAETFQKELKKLTTPK